MPLVFVHGIGNRQVPSTQIKIRERDQLFRRFLFPVIGGRPQDRIENPMWGEEGAALRWGGASLPRGEREALLTDAETDDVCLEAVVTEVFDTEDRLLCSIAERDLADAVDLLFSAMRSEDEGDGWDVDVAVVAEQMAAYCRARERLCPEPEAELRYPWLASVRDDLELIDVLWRESRGWSLTPNGSPIRSPVPVGPPAMGGDPDRAPGRLTRGIRTLRRLLVGPPTVGLAAAARMTVAKRSTTLLGDIFVYLADRGDRDKPGVIPKLVADAIAQAGEDRAPGRPLVVVAHSMGGNIVYDLLTHFRPDLKIDVLVTVGSQVGLFEELALFHECDPSLPSPAQPRVAGPENVGHWINVVDRADILAYRAEPIFLDV